MATSPTLKLVQVIQDGQTQMLDYLRRADERGERQSRATLKALATMQASLGEIQQSTRAIQAGQKDIGQMLLDMQKITVKTLELTRDIHGEVLDKRSSQH